MVGNSTVQKNESKESGVEIKPPVKVKDDVPGHWGFEAIFNNNALGLAMVSVEGKFVSCNKAFSKMLGRSVSELSELTIFQVTYPDDVSKEQEMIREAMSKPGGGSFCFEKRYLRKDGEIVWGCLNASLVKDERGVFCYRVDTVEDITQAKRQEEGKESLELQTLHANKLESLGILAGGIANDFNNLFMGMLGNVDLALAELPHDSPARRSISQIEKAALRAADLSKQMLLYSGKGQFLAEPLDLNKSISEISRLLDISISKKAAIEYRFAPQLHEMEADLAQLRQIIMALISNASDANSEPDASIVVSTGEMYCDRAYLSKMYSDKNSPEGRYIYFEVSDSGCGMDAGTKARIFDPFFTTKTTGQGMELATVLGIVRAHSGAIQVDSKLGKGTSIRVLFPSRGTPSLIPMKINEPSSDWKGNGTVLLVDDEETVRLVGCHMLESLGFNVINAADGFEAIAIIEDLTKKVDCVLMDLIMPRMGGAEVLRRMRRIRPDIRVIVSSGHDEREVARQFEGTQISGIISKPYQLVTLMTLMRSALSDDNISAVTPTNSNLAMESLQYKEEPGNESPESEF